jgi:hypothetical protein
MVGIIGLAERRDTAQYGDRSAQCSYAMRVRQLPPRDRQNDKTERK